jgi:hypothetical protein
VSAEFELHGRPPVQVSCEACGRAFSCGAGTGACWCVAERTDPAKLAALRDEFARCLCPECLRARAGA